MALNAMQLTSRDMARARVMLKEQAEGEDPYDLLDDEGDAVNRDKRRVLIIWALRSRGDPTFTWDMAWDVPFSEVYAEEDEPEAEASVEDPLPAAAPSSSPNGAASSKKKPRADAAAPS